MSDHNDPQSRKPSRTVDVPTLLLGVATLLVSVYLLTDADVWLGARRSAVGTGGRRGRRRTADAGDVDAAAQGQELTVQPVRQRSRSAMSNTHPSTKLVITVIASSLCRFTRLARSSSSVRVEMMK
jgi:hypothetical protein